MSVVGTLCERYRFGPFFVDTQIGNLRDRLGRIEGRLDELREFFFRSGGTAA